MKTVEQLEHEVAQLKQAVCQMQEVVVTLLHAAGQTRCMLHEGFHGIRDAFTEIGDRIDYAKMEVVDEVLRAIKRETEGGEEWKQEQ